MVAPSGDIYLGGSLKHPSTTKDGNFLLKLDSDGTIGWMKSYGIVGENIIVEDFAIGSYSIYCCKDYYCSSGAQYVVIGKLTSQVDNCSQ